MQSERIICNINDSGERENHLSINVNVRFTARSIILDNNVKVSREEMLKAISEKWSKTYESKNEYDFRNGMKIITDVTFNIISKKDGSTDKVRYFDYENNGTNLKEDKVLTDYTYVYLNDGSKPGNSNSDDDYDNKHDGNDEGHQTTSTNLEGIKYMYLFKYDKSSGKKQANSKTDICRAIYHEFGHVLGIMDAYGYDNPNNYYMEPISYPNETGEIFFKYGKIVLQNNGTQSKYFDPSIFGTDEAGEMMHRSGAVSANDIEMVLYARKSKEPQFYVPKGRNCNEVDNKYETTDRFSISPAIKQPFLYICIYESTKDNEKLKDISNNRIIKLSVYWFDFEKNVYVLFDKEDESVKKYLGDEYYNHCVDVISNMKYYYLPELLK